MSALKTSRKTPNPSPRIHGVTENRLYLSTVDELMRDPSRNRSATPIRVAEQLGYDKPRLIAEYALRNIHKPIDVAGCETKLIDSLPKNLRVSLPTIEELEAELSRKPAATKSPKRRKRTDA